MSDYLQILKREKETKRDNLSPVSAPVQKEENIDVEEKKTDKDTFAFALKKKIEKNGNKAKKDESEQKRRIISVNPPAISKSDASKRATVWISLSEASNMGGVQTKTLRRAIKGNKLKFKIVRNRYLVDFASLINYLLTNRKLSNKLKSFGIGQYIKEWKSLD